ncbi:MAG: hypothetical protein ACUVWJ_11175 [Spirochaetota bacterium]
MYRKFYFKPWLFLLLFYIMGIFFGGYVVSAQPFEGEVVKDEGMLKTIQVDIECHSGTPPILEIVLKDSKKLVGGAEIDFDGDGSPELSISRISSEVLFRGVPYRKKGRYRLSVSLDTKIGRFKREFTVAFTDFIWGRDNFRFANDGIYEDKTDFVTERLFEWVEHRFGSIDERQKLILLSVMYDIYRGSIGRCYGFTGGQIYYLENPERIPPPSNSVYLISERDENLKRDMDYVQNDIVLSNLLSGKIKLNIQQTPDTLLEELRIIKDSIDRGRLIILGYISSKMHHSMVVYGYFEDPSQRKVTLLTANNWERDQKNNIFSEDAENLVVQFNESGAHMSWLDLTKNEYRYPLVIFAIQREQNYSFELSDFLSFLSEKEKEIIEEGRIILIVEKTEVAFVVDGEGRRRGYLNNRYLSEVEGIAFKKIDFNYIFKLPAERNYRLVLKKRIFNDELNQYKKVNLYAILPLEDSVQTLIYRDIAVEDDRETVFLVGIDGVKPL